jgi:hypothetical protein
LGPVDFEKEMESVRRWKAKTEGDEKQVYLTLQIQEEKIKYY